MTEKADVVVSLRLTQATWDRVHALAQKLGDSIGIERVAMAQVLRMLIDHGLDEHDD